MPLDLEPQWPSPVSRRSLYRPLAESTLKAPGKKALWVKGAWIITFNRHTLHTPRGWGQGKKHWEMHQFTYFMPYKTCHNHPVSFGKAWIRPTCINHWKCLESLDRKQSAAVFTNVGNSGGWNQMGWSWELWVGGSLNTGLDTAKLQVTS